MGLKLKTNASAALQAGLNVSETEVQVSTADLGKFPTLSDVGTADDVTDAKVAAGTAKDYFHAVIAYQTIADDMRRATRASWREYVRVWQAASDRLHIVRGITGETNTNVNSEAWDIQEGDVITITHTLLASDLPVLEGQLRGEYAGGDNVSLGTSASRVAQVRGKNADFSVQAMIGDRVIKAGAGTVDAASPTLFLPTPDGAATDAKNTVALRGDNIIEGCLTGSLCIVRADGSLDNYPMTGGEFGNAVNIVRWLEDATTVRFKLVSQQRAFINAIFGDFTDAGNDETQTTLILGANTHVVRHVVLENPEGDNGPFVTMQAELPSTVTLEAFEEFIATLSVNGFEKSGSLIVDNMYVDQIVVNDLAGLRSRIENMEASQRLRFPSFDRLPTGDDDVDKGYQPGDAWFSTANSHLYICQDNTAGMADWLAVQFFTHGLVLFQDANVQSGTYTLNTGSFTQFPFYVFNDLTVTQADVFQTGMDGSRGLLVGNKRFYRVDATQFRVEVTQTSQRVRRYRSKQHEKRGTYSEAYWATEDTTNRRVIIRGLLEQE